jgi:hypothetical protein
LPALCWVLRRCCRGCTLWYAVTVIVHGNPINPVDNPIPVYGHTITRDSII